MLGLESKGNAQLFGSEHKNTLNNEFRHERNYENRNYQQFVVDLDQGVDQYKNEHFGKAKPSARQSESLELFFQREFAVSENPVSTCREVDREQHQGCHDESNVF